MHFFVVVVVIIIILIPYNENKSARKYLLVVELASSKSCFRPHRTHSIDAGR